MCAASSGLRHPASASCLGRHSHLAGRCPNNSSLFPPLAAVVVVAAEIVFLICCSETPAGVSEQLFFMGRVVKANGAFRRNPSCERVIRENPQIFPNCKYKIKFLEGWPKRTRRPFLIVLQYLPPWHLQSCGGLVRIQGRPAPGSRRDGMKRKEQTFHVSRPWAAAQPFGRRQLD